MRSILIAFSLSTGFVVPARAQSEAWRAHGLSSVPGIGRAVAWLGDVNGDGVPDWVAGGAAVIHEQHPGSGQVLVASGADGTILFVRAGAPGEAFGEAVARAGDVDGDGIDDIAVGAPLAASGAVFVYSGATGSLLRTTSGPSAGCRFGASLADLGDVDGDGVRDLLVGAPADTSSGSALGLAEIVSGASGGESGQSSGTVANGEFGSVVADAGDVDGDGIDDALVIEQKVFGSAELSVFSGSTFVRLQNWTLGQATSGWTASGAGDVNGNGTPDVIVGNSIWPVTKIWPYTYQGGVWLYEGASGASIRSYNTSSSNLGWLFTGWSVGGAGDVDGDGFADYAFAGIDAFTAHFAVFSGQTGSELMRWSGLGTWDEFHLGEGRSEDVNGDGVPDLLVGLPTDPTGGYYAGEAGVFDPSGRAFLFESHGATRIDQLGRSSALLDDVNGDGVRDVLVGTGIAYGCPGAAKILSGVDGSELRVHPSTSFDDSYAERVVALPDLDGDAIGEYAITVPGPDLAKKGEVEVRSGATGNLLRTLAPSGGGAGEFGASCAVAIQPSGAIELAVGCPLDSNGIGNVIVFDVTTGSVVVSHAGATTEGLGTSVAYVGDVDGDGVGDWIAGAPGYGNGQGEVHLFSGSTGATIAQQAGVVQSDFGASVCGTGDLDGDGTPDFMVGAPYEGVGPSPKGAVHLLSGATRTLLDSWSGTPGVQIGWALTDVGDVNGDGFDDVMMGSLGTALLYSGGTGGLLFRFHGELDGDDYGGTAGIAAPGTQGSMNGDSIPDVAIGAPADWTNGDYAGRLSLEYLDDFYLQIAPAKASGGATVSLASSGGPAGNSAALFLVGVDTTPLFALTAVATLDSQGIWSLSGVVPSGLSGHTAAFQSFTVGFGGKLVSSQPRTLTFK